MITTYKFIVDAEDPSAAANFIFALVVIQIGIWVLLECFVFDWLIRLTPFSSLRFLGSGDFWDWTHRGFYMWLATGLPFVLLRLYQRQNP